MAFNQKRCPKCTLVNFRIFLHPETKQLLVECTFCKTRLITIQSVELK